MRRRMALALILALLLALTAVPEASAKGPFQRVIITSPELESKIIVDDPLALWFLGMTNLEDVMAEPLPDVPEDAAETGYELERQYEYKGNTFRTFDRVRYHPNTNGGRGYVYMIGIEDGWYEYQDHWYDVTPEGEAALQAILAGEQVRCPVVEPRTDHGLSDEPLLGGDKFWFAVTPPDEGDSIAPVRGTRDIEAANATGSLLAHSSLTGDIMVNFYEVSAFSLDSSDVNVYVRIVDGTEHHWSDHLLLHEAAPTVGDFSRYDWEAYFPAPGCYELVAYADYYLTKTYIAVE